MTNETELWHQNYGTERQIERRRAAMPKKLAALGLDGRDLDVSILDLCCGYGECLDALHQRGYRKLTGVDTHVDSRLRGDPRFKLVEADARSTALPAGSFDWVLNIHAMHHLGGVSDLRQFRDECFRLLRPGGKVGIVDFDDRLSIQAAFWWFRHVACPWPPYMRYMTELIRSEWPFLKDYLPLWKEIEGLWLSDGLFKPVRRSSGLFYFYWVLERR